METGQDGCGRTPGGKSGALFSLVAFKMLRGIQTETPSRRLYERCGVEADASRAISTETCLWAEAGRAGIGRGTPPSGSLGSSVNKGNTSSPRRSLSLLETVARGEDSTLPLQGAQARSLVEELTSQMPQDF